MTPHAALLTELVLPQDVELIQAADLLPAQRSMAGCGDDDVAIVQIGGRSSSRIIDHHLASLLRQFREPSDVATAVLRYCELTQEDPETVMRQ